MLFYLFTIICTLPNKCTKAGYIALTFDDGPTEEGTTAVLNMCQELDVPVTFHFVTSDISRSSISNIVRRAVDEGHLVGLRVNPRRDYDSMDESSIKSDVDGQISSLQDVTDKKIKYARAPVENGTTNEELREVLADKDVIQTSYTYCLYDEVSDPEDVPGKLHKLFKSSNVEYDSFIFMLHDEKELNFPTLQDIVTIGRSYGYEFVRLDSCLKGYVPGDVVVSKKSSNNLRNTSGTEGYLIVPVCILSLLWM